MSNLEQSVNDYFEYYAKAWHENGESPLVRWTHHLVYQAENHCQISQPLTQGVGYLADPAWQGERVLDQSFHRQSPGTLSPLLPLSSDPDLAVQFVSTPSFFDSDISVPSVNLYSQSPRKKLLPIAGVNADLLQESTKIANALATPVSLTPNHKVSKPFRLFGYTVRDNSSDDFGFEASRYRDFLDEFDSDRPPLHHQGWPSILALYHDFIAENIPYNERELKYIADNLTKAGISLDITYGELPFEVAHLSGNPGVIKTSYGLCLISGLCAPTSSSADARQKWTFGLDQVPGSKVSGETIVKDGIHQWQTPGYTLGNIAATLHEHQFTDLEANTYSYRTVCEEALSTVSDETQEELYLALRLTEYFAYTKLALDAQTIINTLAQPWLQL